MIFNERHLLNRLKDHFLQKIVCSLNIFSVQYFKYTNGLDKRVTEFTMPLQFELSRSLP